jgi:hypothetical protein
MRNRSGRGNGGSGFVLEALEDRRVLSAATSFALTPGPYQLEPISVATDTRGNTLVLGKFGGIVDFDPRRHHVYAVHGGDLATDPTYFIAKYSQAGIPLWVVPHATEAGRYNLGLRLQAIATDANDNVYMSGTLDGSFDANPSRTHVYRVFTAQDFVENLIWKLNSKGEFVYAVRQQTLSPYLHPDERRDTTTADKLAVDRSGGVYLAGSNPDFDLNLVPTISRFDSAGNLLWSNRMPKLSGEAGSAIAIGPQGDVGFVYSIKVRSDDEIWSVGMCRFSAKGKFISDVTLATIAGPVGETFSLGPRYAPIVASLALDPSDNAVICGNLTDADRSDFDAGRARLALVPRETESQSMSYFAKYTPSGRPIFAKGSSSLYHIRFAGAGIDRSGYIHIAGSFDGSVDMNPDPKRVFLVSAPPGDHDSFAATYDSGGNFVRVDLAHDPNLDDEAYFFAFDPSATSPRAASLAISGKSYSYGEYQEIGFAVFAS